MFTQKLSSYKDKYMNCEQEKKIPTPQEARYSATGDPNPPAPTTKIEDFKSFSCPALHKQIKLQNDKTAVNCYSLLHRAKIYERHLKLLAWRINKELMIYRYTDMLIKPTMMHLGKNIVA